MSDTIETEIMPTQALAIRQEVGAIGILRPADSLDRIADAFKEYQRVCETILDASDYQAYEGKPRKKKSAWRKLATAFNVSTEIMSKEVLRPDGRSVVMAEIRVRASTPGGRQAEALGSCDVNEKCCAGSRGQKCHKAAWKGHYCCQNGCDGRKHWSHPDHDIISTAQTRATNRAIADLIGCGEVSAEELVDDQPQKPQKPQEAPKAQRPPSNTTPPLPTPPAPATAQSEPVKTTPAFRLSMLNRLGANVGGGNRQITQEYFEKLGWLIPGESLDAIELRYVPVNKEQMQKLAECIARFGEGDRLEKPYEPNYAAAPPGAPEPKTPASVIPRVISEANGKAKDPLWWRNVIVPIPPKGVKRDAYLKNPQTIGLLFDMRHGQDDESQAGRQRLWGFVNHFEPKPWIGRDGQERPASETDVKFREALDAFWDYFEREHPEEKL